MKIGTLLSFIKIELIKIKLNCFLFLQLNLLEFEDAWQQYNITGTPTLVHYQDGKEVARSEGSNTEEAFRSLLNDWKAE